MNDDAVEPINRFSNAYGLIFYNSLPEETEDLAMTVMYPFVQRARESQSKQLARLEYLDELDRNWMHGYAYYFMAKTVDDYL